MIRTTSRSLLALGALLLPALSFADIRCADKSVAASAVRTREDIRAFVRCAREYALENGTTEAYRAFHEDERWKSGQFYVFVTSLPTADRGNLTLVHAANPSLEGRIRMPLIDNFGNEFFAEQERLVNSYGGGWLYYTRTNPATGGNEPKASYVEAIDWDGSPAAIGAGIYMRDLPGTCSPAEVNAAALETEPNAERLQELVRCAAYRFEEAGYFAAFELRNNPRWRSGSIYLFVLNSRGMQYFSSNPVTINGVAVEEWSGSLFMERDVASPAAAFDESTLYYDALNPANGSVQRKVAFVKRVMVGGEALLVGSGYYLP